MSEPKLKVIKLNKSEYESLSEKEKNTMYFVDDGSEVSLFFGEKNISDKVRVGNAVDDIEKIKDGTTVVEKALRDSLGNVIKDHYLSYVKPRYDDNTNNLYLDPYNGEDNLISIRVKGVKLPKATTSKDGLMSKEDKVKLGALPTNDSLTSQLNAKVDKTTTILGIDLSDNILLGEFKAALGEAITGNSGLMSAQDKARLDALHALLEEDTANSVVDSINEVLAIFNNYPEGADLVTALAGKVDKIAGKGLSTNDFTTAEKTKLNSIAAGAEVNVQSDWNATSGDALILNKPTFATVATSGSYNDLTNKPSAYTLPKATNTVLGGVKAKAKTTETNEVAIDNDGKLWANSGGGGGSAATPVVRMDKITNTLDLSSFGIPFPIYQLDIEPNKKYVIKSQPGTEGFDGTFVIFTPTGLDYTEGDLFVEYNDTEYKEFTIDIYFEEEATINFVDVMTQTIFYTKVNANVDYTVNTLLFNSIVLPGKTLYTISMVDGKVLIYGWE